MESVQVEKKGIKGAYIGGGIFAILFGLVLLFLYLPEFCWNVLNFQWIWDTSQLGINNEFLVFIDTYLCYTGFPVLLFLISFICLFIGKSKGSVFLKLSCLFSFLMIILNYTAVIFLFEIMLSIINFVNYINLGLAVLALLFMILGIVFMAIQKTHPYRASSFLLFSAIFWLIVDVFMVLAGLLAIEIIAMITSTYLIPIALSLYGLIGGVWMLITCKRRIVIMDKPVEVANETASNPPIVGVPNPNQPQMMPQNMNMQYNQQQQSFNITAQQMPQMAQQNMQQYQAMPQNAQPNQNAPLQNGQNVQQTQQPGVPPMQKQSAPVMGQAPMPQGGGVPPQGMRPNPPQGGQGVPPMGQRPVGIPPQGVRPPYPPRPMPNGQMPQGMRPMPYQGGQGVPPMGPRPMPQGGGVPPQGMRPMPPQGGQGVPPMGQRPMPQGNGVPPQGMGAMNGASNNTNNNNSNNNN